MRSPLTSYAMLEDAYGKKIKMSHKIVMIPL